VQGIYTKCALVIGGGMKNLIWPLVHDPIIGDFFEIFKTWSCFNLICPRLKAYMACYRLKNGINVYEDGNSFLTKQTIQ
jgi:hypothetical protein